MTAKYTDIFIQNKIGSGEPSALGLVQAQGSSSKVLLKVHGLAMIAAWVGCAGTGMMIARYFKNTWKVNIYSYKLVYFRIRFFLANFANFKGSDRLCKVAELSMQCCGKLLQDSFETYFTF